MTSPYLVNAGLGEVGSVKGEPVGVATTGSQSLLSL